ncbi:MAG: hypothetical protein FVQ81_12515 [Candidatus Glassbacteria bacterium]|nr:hypothetical protein [Candidatus Glassbacteria bacterium]
MNRSTIFRAGLSILSPVIIGLCLSAVPAVAAENDVVEGNKPSIPIPETKFSYNWYLAYVNGQEDGADINEFQVRRGYINIASKFNDWISTRITPDVTVEREGDGQGDLKMRLKYAYAKFSMPSRGIFTKPAIEFGLVHTPWLDFEQKVDRYRSQGTMFLQRAGLFNSADRGITFMSLLGGEIGREYQRNVNSKYPGRYGSLAVGIYNGGGYHALENNKNKVFRSRLTLRPLPDVLTGLQCSWLLTLGKGNTAASPDFLVNSGMVSLEDRWFVLTAQYYRGKGNGKGKAVLPDGSAAPQQGYSLFGEYHFPFTDWGMIGRYDYFDFNREMADQTSERFIAGLVYYLPGNSKVFIDLDTVEYQDTGDRDTVGKFTVEVNF